MLLGSSSASAGPLIEAAHLASTLSRPIAVEFDAVSKCYPAAIRPALRAVSLAIPEGELTAVVGGSGSGKTTLLKCVNRLVEPDAGTVRVFGQPVAAADLIALRRKVGYVFQAVGLFPHRTIAENIATVPQLLGWPDEEVEQRVADLLEMVGLSAEEVSHRLPGELSGGQQQRVGFARALAARPPLMLLDEPFGALDPSTRQSLQASFRTLHDQLGLTSLLVTHDMAEALLLADRIVVMREGCIAQADTPARLMAAPADAYVRNLLDVPLTQMRQLGQLAPGGSAFHSHGA